MRRRAFVARLGGSALATALLAACGTAGPTTGPAVTQQAVVSGGSKLQLPTYMPPKAPPPDVPGTRSVPSGYINHPKQLVKSVDAVPGRGGDITIITQTLGSVPVPL